MSMRIVAFNVFGDRLGILPDATSTSFDTPENDMPLLTVEYPMRGRRLNVFMQDTVELAVEIWDGATWVEPPQMRFHLKSGEVNNVQAGETSYRRDFRGLAWLLAGAPVKVYPDPEKPDDAPKRKFLTANAGEIVGGIIADQDRWAPGVTTTFTATRDSAGQAWAQDITIDYPAGANLSTVLNGLTEQGLCDWRFQGRELQLVNPGTWQRERSTGNNPTWLRVQKGALGAPEQSSMEDFATTAKVIGDAGFTVDVPVEGATTVYGTFTKVITQGGVTQESTARAFAQAQTLGAGQLRRSLTWEFDWNTAPWKPYVNMLLGDWVRVDRTSGDQVISERMRVRKINVTASAQGIKGHLTLGSLIDDQQARLAKRVTGMTGGTTAGGSGARPSDGRDDRVPKATTITLASSAGFVNAMGVARSTVRLGWNAVTQSTDNVAISVRSYEIEHRRGTGSDWTQATVASNGTSVAFGDYSPGDTWEFRVRAVAENNQRSAWSASMTVMMVGDIVPPPAPTAPIVSTTLGTVTVRWDGAATGNATMPPDFDHIIVLVDNVEAQTLGSKENRAVITGLTVGSSYAITFVAYDHTGNVSPVSAATTIVVTGVMDDPEAKAAVAAANDKAIEATNAAAKAAEDAARIGTTNDRRFTTATSPPPMMFRGDEFPPGAIWNELAMGTADVISKTYYVRDGQWVETTLDSQYIGILTSGNFRAGSIDGQIIRGNTIGANQLIVSDHDNWIVNSSFTGTIQPHFFFSGNSVQLLTTETGLPAGATNAIKITYNSGGSTIGLIFNGRATAGSIPEGIVQHPVKAGDVIYGSVWVKNLGGTAYRQGLMVYHYDESGAQITTQELGFVTTTTSWQQLTAKFTISNPRTRYMGLVVKNWSSTDAGHVVAVAAPFFARQTGSVLIADGAVKAVNIDAGAVKATHVDAGSISAESGIMSQFFVGAMKFGNATGESLTTTAFRSVDIDGVTVTAPTIQTTRATSRGIKMTPSELAAYSSSGAKCWNVDTFGRMYFRDGSGAVRTSIVDGVVSATGRFVADGGSNGSITINPNMTGYGAGRPSIVFDTTSGVESEPKIFTVTGNIPQPPSGGGGYYQGDLIITGREGLINDSGRSEIRLGSFSTVQVGAQWGPHNQLGFKFQGDQEAATKTFQPGQRSGDVSLRGRRVYLEGALYHGVDGSTSANRNSFGTDWGSAQQTFNLARLTFVTMIAPTESYRGSFTYRPPPYGSLRHQVTAESPATEGWPALATNMAAGTGNTMRVIVTNVGKESANCFVNIEQTWWAA